jgi:hypothetical protein
LLRHALRANGIVEKNDAPMIAPAITTARPPAVEDVTRATIIAAFTSTPSDAAVMVPNVLAAGV